MNDMAKKKTAPKFVLCIKNDNYPASLEVRKIYQVMPDVLAASKHFIRVIDESGDDYLYPESYFLAVELPQATVKALVRAS